MGVDLYVCQELGFWEDFRTVQLQRRLKVTNAEAGKYRLKLRSLVLRKGGGTTGRVRQCSPDEIAHECGYAGKPLRLVQALRDVNEIRFQRGSLVMVGWDQNPTRKYLSRKEGDAERKRLAREEERRRREATGAPREDWEEDEEVSAERPRTVRGQGAPGPQDVRGESDRKKERSADGQPPGAPQGGESATAARWDRFWELYPKPENERETRALFAALSPEDQARVLLTLGADPRAPGSMYERTSLRWVPGSAKFLRLEKWRGDAKKRERMIAAEQKAAERAAAEAAKQAAASASGEGDGLEQLRREWSEKRPGEPWPGIRRAMTVLATEAHDNGTTSAEARA